LYRRDSVIDEIKTRCDIVDVIGRVVNLKRAGSNYKGLCPFHNEKTPSFVVSGQKQIFTCFGCGATGDVIEFVQKYNGLDFREALEKLAEETGVTLDSGYRKDEDREQLYEINRQAARYFYKAMRQSANPGWDYMAGRGLTPETMKKFGIGYADDSWDGLYNHLKSMGFEEEQMMKLGLISHSKGKYYDKFRGRVIFPIQNVSGKVIGFGGRTLEKDGIPKYLNSQESPVFYKKNNLYGLNISRREIGREDRAVLVEGYMDAISLYQGGVRNVAASLGTALTENQAAMLKRYTRNIVLCYDSDSAGRAAALRGSDILHREGLKVKVMQVTDGKDPDDFIRHNGKEAFLRLADQALPFADYRLALLEEEFDLDTIEGRTEFLEGAAAVLNQLEPVEADLYANRLSSEYGISSAALKAQMQRSEGGEVARITRAPHRARAELTMTEKNVLKILLTDSSYMEKDPDIARVFTSLHGETIFKTLKSVYKPGEEFDIAVLKDKLSPEESESLRDVDEKVMLAGSSESIFKDCIHTAIMDELKDKEEKLIARLSMADEEANKEGIRSLTEELIETQKMIKLGGR
jgi:DNA primase